MLEYDLILKKKKSELFSDAIYQSGAPSVFRKTGSDRKRPIHTFLQTGSSRKNQNDSFLGRIPGFVARSQFTPIFETSHLIDQRRVHHLATILFTVPIPTYES